VNAALDFWNVFLFSFVQNRVVRRLRCVLFAKILQQEAAFFDANKAGSLSSRLTSDCVAIASDLSWVFRNVAESFVRVAGIAAYLLFQNVKLGVVACGATPLVALAARLYGEWMSKNATASQDALALANAAALEAIANARTVKAFANEKYESRRYDRALTKWYKLSTTQAYVTGGYYALVYSFCSQLLVPAALLAYGCELVVSGSMPAERLVAAMLYQSMLQEYVGNLLDAVTSMYKSSGAASAAFALIDRSPRVYNSGNAVIADFSGTVKLSGVHFSYPTRPDKPILRGLTLKANKGSVTAIVGQSGSGKSTVFRLLMHFYEPTLGAVTLDGVDVSMLSSSWLHSVIGIVSQEPVLFAGTVLDNITYSRRAREADRAEARAAEQGGKSGGDETLLRDATRDVVLFAPELRESAYFGRVVSRRRVLRRRGGGPIRERDSGVVRRRRPRGVRWNASGPAGGGPPGRGRRASTRVRLSPRETAGRSRDARGVRGERARVHQRDASRVPHRGWRGRRAAEWRAKAARRHRARGVTEPGGASPGRGDVVAGPAGGDARAGGAGRGFKGAHDSDHRAQAERHTQRRQNLRPAGRRRGGERHARVAFAVTPGGRRAAGKLPRAVPPAPSRERRVRIGRRRKRRRGVLISFAVL
jgi:ABC-type transport system involved in Fe-S cluster assembly fused permease/ATPase subunit